MQAPPTPPPQKESPENSVDDSTQDYPTNMEEQAPTNLVERDSSPTEEHAPTNSSTDGLKADGHSDDEGDSESPQPMPRKKHQAKQSQLSPITKVLHRNYF